MNKVRKKVRDQLERDDFWMGMAFLVAANSQNTRQQGAVLLAANGDLLTVTHDGILQQNLKPADSAHFPSAEINALLTVKSSAHGGTLYLTHTPGYPSVLAITAAFIKRLVYFPTKKMDENSLEALRAAYVQGDEFSGNLNWMRDYMKALDMLGIFESQSDK